MLISAVALGLARYSRLPNSGSLPSSGSGLHTWPISASGFFVPRACWRCRMRRRWNSLRRGASFCVVFSWLSPIPKAICSSRRSCRSSSIRTNRNCNSTPPLRLRSLPSTSRSCSPTPPPEPGHTLPSRQGVLWLDHLRRSTAGTRRVARVLSPQCLAVSEPLRQAPQWQRP